MAIVVRSEPTKALIKLQIIFTRTKQEQVVIVPLIDYRYVNCTKN